ncbi:MAG: helix-turn-helix domain-containing protein [Beutenbergiaceae bacterium]
MSWPSGPSSQEVDAYRILVESGPISAQDVAQRLSQPESDVRVLLQALAQQGLATETSEGQYLAAPPRSAMTPILERALGRAHEVQEMISDLDERYRRRGGGVEASASVTIIEGATAMSQRADQLFNETERQLYAMADAADLHIHPSDGYPALIEAVARGIEHRVIVAQSTLETRKELTGVRLALSEKSQFRSTSRIPTRMFILDERILWIPILAADGAAARAMVVTATPLVVIALELFEQMWRVARPMGLNETSEAAIAEEGSELADTAILGLLLTGITDQAIAHQLGTSVRTVQRRVRNLMEETGSSSRIQLGYEAGRRGWLE